MRINHFLEGNNPPSLYICSPSYSGEFNCHFVVSLLQTIKALEKEKFFYQVEFEVFNSLAAGARNILADNFLKSQCSHMLMIDADQGWTPEAVPKMLKLDKDVLTGAVISRKPNEEIYALKIHTNTDRTPLVNNEGLIDCASNGVAFAMIKREVFEKIKETKEYKNNVYPFFQHVYYQSGGELGEDTYFINEWNKLGKTWIYPDITFIHGTNEGNYHEYLLKQPQPGIELPEFKQPQPGIELPELEKAINSLNYNLKKMVM